MKKTPHTKIAYGVAFGLFALWWLVPGCGETTNLTPGAENEAGAPLSWPDASACVPLAACTTSACPTNPDGGFGCYWTCGQASLCNDAHFSSGSNPCSSSGCAAGTDASATYTVDTTNARCVLSAMRDGTIGEVTWGTTADDVDVFSTYEEAVNLIAGRQAYGWWSETDGPSVYQRYAGKQLKPASFFQTCLDSNDVPTYLSCLQNAYESCP
jgi:hypothetical protein